ncbi:MAG: RluA family pseudouridine synthase [Bryobacterales bacterium]|nr:RluA family pseudouridine synthase [Bryobacterales bacterium]
MINLQTAPSDAGTRLDHYLQSRLPQYSRSRLQQWIKAGRVTVDDAPAKPSALLKGQERIAVAPEAPPRLHATPEDLPVEVLYSDASVLAVNKPAGMVVHLGAGHHSGTLVNALLHHFEHLSEVGGTDRPGIVHRLDKLTSGIVLVARTDAAHRALARQFAERTVKKIYLALVHGVVKQDHGRISAPIERDPVHRMRMTCRTGRGRAAFTDYTVLRRGKAHTYLSVDLHTGRTHQIRVHMASLGHPIAGDDVYGPKEREPLGRYFLHAHRVKFTSPASGEVVTVEAPLPADLAQVLCRFGLE